MVPSVVGLGRCVVCYSSGFGEATHICVWGPKPCTQSPRLQHKHPLHLLFIQDSIWFLQGILWREKKTLKWNKLISITLWSPVGQTGRWMGNRLSRALKASKHSRRGTRCGRGRPLELSSRVLWAGEVCRWILEVKELNSNHHGRMIHIQVTLSPPAVALPSVNNSGPKGCMSDDTTSPSD